MRVAIREASGELRPVEFTESSAIRLGKGEGLVLVQPILSNDSDLAELPPLRVQSEQGDVVITSDSGAVLRIENLVMSLYFANQLRSGSNKNANQLEILSVSSDQAPNTLEAIDRLAENEANTEVIENLDALIAYLLDNPQVSASAQGSDPLLQEANNDSSNNEAQVDGPLNAPVEISGPTAPGTGYSEDSLLNPIGSNAQTSDSGAGQAIKADHIELAIQFESGEFEMPQLIGGDFGEVTGDEPITVIGDVVSNVSVMVGKLVDGYIENALVFADANGNGVYDEGEASATTDANGNYSMSGEAGDLVATGGTDVSSGVSYSGIFTAPAGSSVITPLTTLMVSLIENGQASTADEAEAMVKTALGLTTNETLTSYDPVQGVADGDSDALAILGAGSKLINMVHQIKGALQPTAQDADAFMAAGWNSLAETVGDSVGAIDLTGDDVKEIVEKAAGNAKVELTRDQVDNVVNTVQLTNAETDAATNAEEVANVAAVADNIATDLSDGTADNDYDDLEFEMEQQEADYDTSVLGDSGGNNLDGGDNNDLIDGLAGDDLIDGKGGNDSLIGGGGNDILIGGDGDDELIGGAGNDVLFGDAGDDVLIGGAGRDQLTGGDGKNKFVFTFSDLNGGVDNVNGDFYERSADEDIISDFKMSDVIDVRDLFKDYDDSQDINDWIKAEAIYTLSGDFKEYTVIQVDADGAGDAYNFEDLVILDNTSIDIDDLLGSRALLEYV